MGWVTAPVEQASAWVDWNPGIAPTRLVARAQILTLVAGPGAAAKRDRGGWLWLEVALLSLPSLDSALLLNVNLPTLESLPRRGRDTLSSITYRPCLGLVSQEPLESSKDCSEGFLRNFCCPGHSRSVSLLSKGLMSRCELHSAPEA